MNKINHVLYRIVGVTFLVFASDIYQGVMHLQNKPASSIRDIGGEIINKHFSDFGPFPNPPLFEIADDDHTLYRPEPDTGGHNPLSVVIDRIKPTGSA